MPILFCSLHRVQNFYLFFFSIAITFLFLLVSFYTYLLTVLCISNYKILPCNFCSHMTVSRMSSKLSLVKMSDFCFRQYWKEEPCHTEILEKCQRIIAHTHTHTKEGSYKPSSYYFLYWILYKILNYDHWDVFILRGCYRF